MDREAVGSRGGNGAPRARMQAAPSLGLRGGLGKTLLTAFLLLAIVPLALLSFVTYRQVQADARQRVVAALETTVALKEAHLVEWVVGYERTLALLAGGRPEDAAGSLAERLAAIQGADPALQGLVVGDQAGVVMAAVPAWAQDAAATVWPALGAEGRLVLAARPAGVPGSGPLVVVGYEAAGQRLVGLLDWRVLQEIVTGGDGQGAGAHTWLVTSRGIAGLGEGLRPLHPGAGQEGADDVSGVFSGRDVSGVHTGIEGTLVYGASRWIPGLGVGLLAEYPQEAALAAGNAVTAMILGATLAVALITAAIAAAVTRRLTAPIVALTETAAWMARGDLNQQVAVNRKDEIGVLGRAFNRMAAELRVLYGALEEKVAERTRQLEQAHVRTRYYAMQLSISAEVARIASSIRCLEDLLPTVVKLIGDAFELRHVAIYLLDPSGERAVWQAGSNGLVPSQVEVVGGLSLVGQVAADGQRRVLRLRRGAGQALGDPARAAGRDKQGFDPPSLGVAYACELAVPLQAGRRMLGVLHLQSERGDAFDASDEMVFQSLADQISIAMENARAYGIERDTVRRLRALDRMQAEFLTNMSHALRTPLNSIIGFSRIMLKELDGPLTDVQRSDVGTIYESGRQLLGLMNDMFELSQLELGAAPFSVSKVDLVEVIDGVMATAQALARSKPVRLGWAVADDVPALYTDRQRVRQLILALVANAIKLTSRGRVWLAAAAGEDEVVIRVESRGVEVSAAELERLFAEDSGEQDGANREGPGFGLAISRRVVDRLGGRIWVEDRGEEGVVLASSLPVGAPATRAAATNAHTNEDGEPEGDEWGVA